MKPKMLGSVDISFLEIRQTVLITEICQEQRHFFISLQLSELFYYLTKCQQNLMFACFLIIIFYVSGCSIVSYTITKTFPKPETKSFAYYLDYEFEKYINYEFGHHGMFSTPDNVKRIISEATKGIQQRKKITQECQYYLYKAYRLTHALIELGRFDDAMRIAEQGLYACVLIDNCLQQNNMSGENGIIVKPLLYLSLYKGYILWFSSENKEKSLELFNIFDDIKIIGKQLEIIKEKSDISIWEYIVDYLYNTGENFIARLAFDRACFYYKISGDYYNSFFTRMPIIPLIMAGQYIGIHPILHISIYMKMRGVIGYLQGTIIWDCG